MASFKVLLLTVLVLQNTLSALLGRYTRQAVPADELYDISHFILVSEVFKLVLSFVLESMMQGKRSTHIWERPLELFKMAIPAGLYLGSNTLLYVAISNLNVPIFQVSYQTKLVVTALVSVVMLGRRYTLRQWACLVVISVSVAMIAVEEKKTIQALSSIVSQESTETVVNNKGPTKQSLLIGLTAVGTACLLSALAGVYFEKVVKTPSKDTPSLWMRNIQLAFFSILIAMLQTTFLEGGGESVKENKAFLHGFTPLVWCQVLLFAGGGLLVSAVIKYADNVVKGLATGLSVLLSTTASMLLYGTPISPVFCICAITTIASVWLFSNEGLHNSKIGPCSMVLVALGLSGSNRVRRSSSYGFILVAIAALQNLANMGSMDLTNSTIVTGVGGKPQEPENSVENDQTDLFPADWNSTITALQALRDVQNRVVERNFHEATHILYDLRTHLGNRPVKYLEIGSYTGISSSLVLRHPFPTMATLVDPCTLPKSHFKGTLTQEQTIRKNLASLVPNGGCKLHRPYELRVGYSPAALPKNETFDIIFINGDHSNRSVWADYTNTINLLRPGGFMVFDDYLDTKWSPAVRPAVDNIAKITDLIPLGSPRNIHGIHPHANSSFINEYIFQKPGKFTFSPIRDPTLKYSNPVLCVAVATYRRPDGSTPAFLENLWKMLERQSYTKWELYMTGDFYDDENEWQSFSFYNDPRVHMYNMPEPGERGKMTGLELWRNAGATAMNNAIERVVADGKEWVVHLDDDDIWDSDHLQNIVEGIRTGATFVMTYCQFIADRLPKTAGLLTNITHDVLPRPCRLIHSSVAFNAAKIKARYTPFPASAADAYMWARIVFEEAFYSAFVPVMSCHHLKEGGRRQAAPVLRKSVFDGGAPPPGWQGPEYQGQYHALAASAFPDLATLSKVCQFVIGPKIAPSGPPVFKKMTPDKIPYFISSVKAFDGLPVWELAKFN